MAFGLLSSTSKLFLKRCARRPFSIQHDVETSSEKRPIRPGTFPSLAGHTRCPMADLPTVLGIASHGLDLRATLGIASSGSMPAHLSPNRHTLFQPPP